MAEGLQWSFVKYEDNQACLDLIEGCPVSVFSLLNEVHGSPFVLLFLMVKIHKRLNKISPLIQESRLNRASDARTFRVRLEKELCHNPSISWDKFSKEPHFSVAHYAAKVQYQIQEMVEKNKVCGGTCGWRKTRRVRGMCHLLSCVWRYRIQSLQKSSASF